MSNPFRSLKYLPWSTLLLSAGLTILVATAVDIVLWIGIDSIPAIRRVLYGSPILQLIGPVLAAYGIGALSIVLTLNFFRQIPLRANTMWALVGCVLFVLLMKSQLSFIPALFVQGPSYFGVVAIAVGTFTQGRQYWR